MDFVNKTEDGIVSPAEFMGNLIGGFDFHLLKDVEHLL
jgi:hypothetical protein